MKTRSMMLLGIVTLCACSSKKAKVEESSPVEVEVMRVMPTADGASVCTYSGTIEAGRIAELSFTSGGTLTNVPVETGMRVAKGQLVAEVNPQLASDDYKLALANEAKALDAYQRYNNMYEKNSLPEAQWVEVKNALEQARIQVRVARKQLSDCRLTAPFSGYVLSKDAQSGQNVSAGICVVSVADISMVKASFHVPSADLQSFRQGQEIRVVVPELNGKRFRAIVTEKGIGSDSYTFTYTIKSQIANTGGELLPGMLCILDGHKTEDTARQVIIPEDIVQIGFDNTHFVWIVCDGKAERRMIETGEVTASGIVVKDGLSLGDSIIVGGRQKVFDGATVRVKKGRVS